MPQVFDYLDHKEYLMDFYSAKKAKKKSGYSYRVFSRKAGFACSNFLQLVAQGKRKLTNGSIAGFTKALQLDEDEAGYFNHLVKYNQADNEKERQSHYQKLLEQKRYREIKKLDIDSFEYLSQWYYSAIRELVSLPEFQPDPVWIAKRLRPSITPEQADQALALLQKLGFLVKAGDTFLQSQPHIVTSKEIKSKAIRNFHKQMITRALEAIDKAPAPQREISSVTACVSKDTFEEVKSRIQEFRREINVLLEKEKSPDAVFQINFQFFGLSEVPWNVS